MWCARAHFVYLDRLFQTERAYMNGQSTESRTTRPRRTSPVGHQAPQLNAVKAREQAKISSTPENWRDELLASGPNRGVHFEVQLGSMMVVRAHRIDPFPGGRVRGRVFFCPVSKRADLAACEAWINRYYPEMGVEQ